MHHHPRHTPTVLCALKSPKTFNELEQETRIPPSTLSRSLRILHKNKLIETRPLTEEEEKHGTGMWKYQVTKKGKDALPVAQRAVTSLNEFWRIVYPR